jgi:hypothetical protein
MVERELALLCAALLLWPLSVRTVLASQGSGCSSPNVKERIAEIPAGAIIEVKIRKQPKVRGRLGAVTDSGFEVQHLKNDKFLTDTIAFQDVKSVKVVGHGMSLPLKIVTGTLIGAGVLLVIGLVACLAGGCSSW